MAALTAVIFLTEAALAIIFFSLVQQYPAYLLARGSGLAQPASGLIAAGAAYTGYALSAYGLAKFPGQPLSGWLADRYGARRVLTIGLALCLLDILVMAAGDGLAAFIAACGVYGFAAAVVWPAVYSLVGDMYAESLRGRITAAISGAQLAGSAGGFVAGAFAIDHAGFPAAFGLAFALNALALILGFALAGGRSFRSARQAEPERLRSGLIRRLQGLGVALSTDLVLLTAILVLISLAVSLLAPDLRPYSATVLKLRFSAFALLLAAPAAAAVLTLLPAGIIADAFGRGKPMVIAAALWVVALMALTVTRSIVPAVLCATIAAFSYALGLPAWSASLIDLSTVGHRGLQVGLASAVQAIGMAAGPAAGGLLVAHLGALAPFRCSAALMLVVLVLSLVYHLHTSPARRCRAATPASPSGS